MTNKHLSRGVAIQDGKKVFVIGYAFYMKPRDKWYIISEWRQCEFEPESIRVKGNELCESENIEVISEPDRCLGIEDIEGKMIFENDEVRVRNRKGEWRKFIIVYEKGGLEFKENKTGSMWLDKVYLSEWTCEIRLLGNTYGIADGIKEGE